MTHSSRPGSRYGEKDSRFFNLWVRAGMIIKILMAIALFVAIAYMTEP